MILFLFCLISTAQADDKAYKYSQALSRAKDAAMIQSGVQGRIDTVKGQLEAYGKAQADLLGVGEPLGVVLYCSKVYHDKSLTIPLTKTEKLQLKTDQAAITINF